MANRPIFIASLDSLEVKICDIEFKWFPGYSISQKQKSIEDLHKQGNIRGITNILEVSSKSPLELGVRLSAFNLKTKTQKHGKEFSVETAFQGSKVFQNGGPFTDLIFADSAAAKKDARIKKSGPLVRFDFFGYSFKLKPRTLFYDWLYINTLLKNKELIADLMPFTAFTDIEFNPQKSINCQAFSLALFRTLIEQHPIADDKIEPDEFEERTKAIYKKLNAVTNLQTQLKC